MLTYTCRSIKGGHVVNVDSPNEVEKQPKAIVFTGRDVKHGVQGFRHVLVNMFKWQWIWLN